MGIENNQIRSKHHSSCLLGIVVHLTERQGEGEGEGEKEG